MAVPGSIALGNDGEADPVVVICPEVHMVITFVDTFWPVDDFSVVS